MSTWQNVYALAFYAVAGWAFGKHPRLCAWGERAGWACARIFAEMEPPWSR